MTDYQKLSKAQLIQELKRLQSSQVLAEDTQDLYILRHDLEVHQIELEMQNRELRDKQRELELARDKYADLYEFAPIGYLTLDDKGIIREINLTATGMLDRTRSQLFNQPFIALFTNGNSREFFRTLRAVLADGEEKILELQLKGKDTTSINVQLQMVPPTASKPEVRVALIDVSDQKRAEAEARDHREALLHAGRLSMLGELSSGIAHEISQPIAAIGSYAEVLSKMAQSGQITESKLVEIADKIAVQSNRAGAIINQVRSFARRQAPLVAQQNILDVIKDAVGLEESAMKYNNIDVEIHKQNVLRDVEIDRVQIVQVLVNLLHNAIEAMHDTPPRQREIVIDVSMSDHEHLEVAVADNGVGIPPEVLDRWFQPFFTTRDQGLGLGLSLSYSIVEAHGGQLWAESNSPQGAVFRFVLPIANPLGKRG